MRHPETAHQDDLERTEANIQEALSLMDQAERADCPRPERTAFLSEAYSLLLLCPVRTLGVSVAFRRLRQLLDEGR